MTPTRHWRAAAVAVALTAVALPLAAAGPAAAAGGTATADTVSYWNSTLLTGFQKAGGPPPPLARAAAIVHAGIYDVLDAARNARFAGTEGSHTTYAQYLTRATTTASVDDDLAAGIAAHDLLVYALPSQKAYFDAQFSARYGSRTQSAASTLAGDVVSTLTSARTGDGSASSTPYTLDGVPGSWRPTGSMCSSVSGAAVPSWGKVKPFVLTSTTQFRQPLPGGYTSYAALLASSLYADNLNRAKALGDRDAPVSVRSATDTQTAFFWANDLDGTYKPPGQLLETTDTVVRARLTEPIAVAKVFTQVSLALADAAIAAWDQKYLTTIDLWRPQTAVNAADTDGNAATTKPSSTWQPLSQDASGVSFSPCFPAWVSGHAEFAGAWSSVMQATFGNGTTFTVKTQDVHAKGVVRTYSSFSTAAQEMANSRLFLGVHYPFDADAGLASGGGVGSFVANNTLQVTGCNLTCT